MTVAVRVLGPVELLVDDLPVPIERIQVRRLLALLARCPGRHVEVHALIDQLWPGDLPQDPVASLRVITSRLRAALGRCVDSLRSGPAGLVLDVDPVVVDAVRFEEAICHERSGTIGCLGRLDAALGLWRGTPFSGAHGPPSLDAAAAALVELHDRTEVERAELLIELGRVKEAIVSIGARHERDPLDERVAAAFAVALAHDGRAHDGLAALRRTRLRLRDELGLSPGPHVRDAERWILEIGTPVATSALGPAGPARPRIHGRTNLLDDVHGQCTRVAAPRRCIVVTGPAGIGKTVFAEAVAARLGRPMLRVAYDERAGRTGLVDALGLAPTGARHGAQDHAIALRRDVSVILDAIERAMPQPFVLLLDDLHRAPAAELAVIRRLVADERSAHAVVLMTCRPPSERNDDVARTLEVLTSRAGALVVPLPGLDERSCRRLVSDQVRAAVSVSTGRELYELTGGNPYLLRCLAAAGPGLDGPPPSEVAALLEARVASIAPADRATLEHAAVLGDPVDVILLAATSRRTQANVAATLDRAINSTVLRADGSTIRFEHELTRRALAARLGPARQQLISARAADSARSLGRDVVTLAGLVLGAGPLASDEVARRDLVRGADTAQSRGRSELAMRFLDRAVELDGEGVRRLDVQRRLAWVKECAGLHAAADDLYDHVQRAAHLGRHDDVAARAALGGAAFGGVVGGDARRARRLEASVQRPPADRRLHLEVLAAHLDELTAAERPIPTDLLAAIDELATDDPADSSVEAWMRVRSIGRRPVHHDDAEALGRARLTAIAAGDAGMLLRVDERLVHVHLCEGHSKQARLALDDLSNTTTVQPWPRYVWSSTLYEAVLTDLCAGPVAAAPLAREAMRVGRELGITDAVNAYSMFQLSVAYRERRLAPLEPFVRAALESPRAIPAWHATLAAVLAETGQVDAARRELDTYLHRASEHAVFADVGGCLAIRAATLLGARDAASSLVERLQPWSGTIVIVGAGAAAFGAADHAIAGGLDLLDATAAALAARARADALMAAAGATAWDVTVS